MNTQTLKRFGLATLLLLLGLFPTAAQEIAPSVQPGWSTGALMPTPRSELASALLDGMIYVAGGIGTEWTTRTEVERYDIAADAWESVAPLPVGLHHLGMAALNGRIYVSGGYTDMSFTANQAATYSYDPATNTWTGVADMPAPRAAHAMVALMGKLYVVGGVGPRAEELWVYDPASDTWDTSAPPLPTPREHLAAVGMDNQLHVIGGRVDGSNLGTLENYAPELSQWYPLPQMPTPRGGLTAGMLDGSLHVTGGELFQPPQTFNQHEAFEFGEWKTLDPMPTARHGLTSVTYQGRWYVIGGATEATGRTAETATGLVEIYTIRAPYPAETRTGIPAVDTVIEARLTNDLDRLVDLAQFITLNCVTNPEGLGGPPLCADGEADGTPVEVLPLAFSEGTYVRRGDIERQFAAGNYTLYAVYRVPESVARDPNFPAGEYAAVFIDEDRSFFNAVNLRLNDQGIVRIDYGSWREMVSVLSQGDAILPPRVPVEIPPV